MKSHGKTLTSSRSPVQSAGALCANIYNIVICYKHRQFWNRPDTTYTYGMDNAHLTLIFLICQSVEFIENVCCGVGFASIRFGIDYR